MRIGVGKKVGKVYVGTSVSAKKAANGMSMLFLWPFYLIYYVCVWPIVAIIKYLVKNSGQSTRMSAAETESIKRVIVSTAKVLTETKKPDTFFSRLDTFNENIEKLKGNKTISIGGGKTKKAIEDLENDIPAEINSFIDRYAKEMRLKIYNLTTEKAKENKANAFKNTLSEYNDKMTEENIEYYLKKYDELLELKNQ